MISIISRFEPSNLSNAQQDSDNFVYEVGFQQEFPIQANFFLKKAQVQAEYMYVSDELTSRRAGCLDFRITFNSRNRKLNWGIELLRFSTDLQGHVERFMPERNGAYTGLNDYVTIDFMHETEFKSYKLPRLKYRNLDKKTNKASKVLIAVFTSDFTQVTFYKWNSANANFEQEFIVLILNFLWLFSCHYLIH